MMTDERSGNDRRLDMETVRELATHASDIKHLQDDMDKLVESVNDMQKTLADINATLSEAKGGWKTLIMIGSMSSVLGAGLVQVVHWWNK
jgi:prefoldin subunit 5